MQTIARATLAASDTSPQTKNDQAEQIATRPVSEMLATIRLSNLNYVAADTYFVEKYDKVAFRRFH